MSSSEIDYTRYLNLLYRNRKLFLAVSLAIMTVVMLVSYFLPRKYEARSTVFIEKNVISDLVKGIAVTPTMENTVKVLNYALNSRTLVVKVINELDYNVRTKNDAELEQMIADIQKGTMITVKDNDLFVISFKHENPRFARDYVNTLVRSYIEQNVSSKREETFMANQFLGEQIKAFKEKKEKAEAAVDEFKREKGSTAGLDEGRLLQGINDAQQKIYDLQMKRKVLEGQQAFAKNAANPLQTKLKELQKRLEELRAMYTEAYPEVIHTKAQIEALRQEISSRKGEKTEVDPLEGFRIDTELKAIAENEKNLQNYIADNRRLLNTIPTSKADLQKLEAERINQKNMYDLLFIRQDQSELGKQMELQDKTTNFRIVDPAVTPVKPVSPNRVRIILMGIAAGIACGAGLLLLIDSVDQSARSVDALQALNLPVLAIIPLITSITDIQLIRKKDKMLYLMCSFYFSLILSVLVMELLGVPLVDNLMSRVTLPKLVSKLAGFLK
jgi:polysaccharide chain length determinant protein (PEP-CTERM system associated)